MPRDSRDICEKSNGTLAECLGPYFTDATENDALIIGSQVFGARLAELLERCGDDCLKSRAWCVHAPLLATSLANEHADELLEALLAVYPGQVRTEGLP